MENSLACRVWASETSPHGLEHRCHAGGARLKGQIHGRDQIIEDLKIAPNLGGIWHVIACEPLTRIDQCTGCDFKFFKGLAPLYGEV